MVAWTASQALERLLRVVGLDRLFDRSTGRDRCCCAAGSRRIRLGWWGKRPGLVMILPPSPHGRTESSTDQRFRQVVLAYVPHLVTAGLIWLAGWLLSNFVSQAVLIAAVNADCLLLDWWRPAPVGIQLPAVAMALEQLGIARKISWSSGLGLLWEDRHGRGDCASD